MGNAVVDRLCLFTSTANHSPKRGWVKANIWHLKTGSSQLRDGNPNWRVPGPPGWELEHGADTPTFLKTFTVKKPEVTSWPNLWLWPGNLTSSQKRKNNWNLATWNVRSLFRAGALRNLTQELKRCIIMIVAIQETRWQGSKIFGTCFITHMRVKDHMLNFELVNEQCYLRVKGKFFNITVICVQAPTEVNDNRLDSLSNNP
jgi:hypothetical protein